jgi:hypothetical protein
MGGPSGQCGHDLPTVDVKRLLFAAGHQIAVELAHGQIGQPAQAAHVVGDRPEDAAAVHDIVGDKLGSVTADRGVLVVVVGGAIAHVGRQLRRQLSRVIPRDEIQDVN